MTFRSALFIAVILVLTAGAFRIRSTDIGNRPMHGDEAVHAEKFRDLWEKGVYTYDSNEYHGPTIYYAALPSVILHGRKSWADTREADYRLPIAVFGAGMLLLLLPLADGLGKRAALAAALFIAISPAFVFYSRYFIQEVPFVFFTLGMLACGWRFCKTRRAAWLAASGVSAGLMMASKETAVLTFTAMAVSVVLTVAYGRWLNAKSAKALPGLPGFWQQFSLQYIALFAAIAVAVACLLISGIGRNLHGPIDYLKSYTPWFHRAQGNSLHSHPFGYYLQILTWYRREGGQVWNELLIVVLSVIGVIAALWPGKKRFVSGSITLWRFIAFFTLILTLIYSVIPYKTPWCLLSFLMGMCLLAGLGVVAILDRLKLFPIGIPSPEGSKSLRAYPLQIGALYLLYVASAQLNHQAYRASFVAYADPHNPYVYAATASDIVNFQQRIDDLAKYWPEHQNIEIKVFATSNYYWPIPWYLRRYPNVGYYPRLPINKEEAEAPVTICATELDEPMSALLNDADLMNGMNEIRSGVFFETFIRMDVWTAYLNGKNGGAQRRIAPPPPAE